MEKISKILSIIDYFDKFRENGLTIDKIGLRL